MAAGRYHLKTTIAHRALAISTCVLLSCEPAPIDISRGVSPEADRETIIGGVETHYDSWQSVLMVLAGNVLCTGTLIHPEVVLTAGHCVLMAESGYSGWDYTHSPSSIAVWGGAAGETFIAGVDAVRVHPGWDGIIGETVPDVALLRLDRAVTTLEPQRLRDFPMPAVDDPAVIVGYGVDESGVGGRHRFGDTTILDVNNFFIENGGESNTCSGDSGGPLFTEQDGAWVVTGVTSFGVEECQLDDFGFSLNLLGYCDWLNETMLDLVGEDLGLEYCQSCRAVSVDDWGTPCGPGYPCCEPGSRCRYPDGFSRNGLGYCAPDCCQVGGDESEFCTDVADGTEVCRFIDDIGSTYCAVECEDDDDCPTGTICRNEPYASDRICIAGEPGSGETLECDTEWDTDETKPDAETGASDEAGCNCTVPAVTKQRIFVFNSLKYLMHL